MTRTAYRVDPCSSSEDLELKLNTLNGQGRVRDTILWNGGMFYLVVRRSADAFAPDDEDEDD